MEDNIDQGILNIALFPFPCLCLVYLWIGVKLRCQRMDALAILILGLYFLVLLVDFVVKVSPLSNESLITIIFSIVGNHVIWAIIFLFVIEMLKYKYIVTVRDQTEYS